MDEVMEKMEQLHKANIEKLKEIGLYMEPPEEPEEDEKEE